MSIEATLYQQFIPSPLFATHGLHWFSKWWKDMFRCKEKAARDGTAPKSKCHKQVGMLVQPKDLGRREEHIELLPWSSMLTTIHSQRIPSNILSPLIMLKFCICNQWSTLQSALYYNMSTAIRLSLPTKENAYIFKLSFCICFSHWNHLYWPTHVMMIQLDPFILYTR